MSSQSALDDSAVNATSPSASPSPEPADHASSTNGRPNDKSKKRASADDGSEPPHKVTKRRAARACVSCRARKVRCDVVEGAPCGNCRWDNVEVRSPWHTCFASYERFSILSHPENGRIWLTSCFLLLVHCPGEPPEKVSFPIRSDAIHSAPCIYILYTYTHNYSFPSTARHRASLRLS